MKKIHQIGATPNLEQLISTTIPSEEFGDFAIHIMDFNNVIDGKLYEAVDELRSLNGGVIYFIDNYSEEPYMYISPTAFDVNLHSELYYLEDVQTDIIRSNNCSDCPDWMKEIWIDEYNPNENSSLTYVAPAISLSAIDGPLPVADAVIAAAAAVAITYDLTKRVYITYIAYNPVLDQHYCGRTSGFKQPMDILQDRINRHHALNVLNFSVDVDVSIQGYPIGYWAVRGREQQNVDYFGGALLDPGRRPDATCVNRIRGVGKLNPLGYLYHWTSSVAWGEKYPYTGYGTTDIEELWSAISIFIF